MLLVIAVLFSQSAAEDIPKLIEALSADDIHVRTRAAADLRTRGEAAIPPLEKARDTKDAQLRTIVGRLLHDLGAVSALVEDLRSDDTPGNARAARSRLRERYGPEVKAALMRALAGDDDQQATQATHLLLALKEQGAAIAKTSGLLERIARMIARGRDKDFRWVALEAVVGLGQAVSEDRRNRAWTDALADVDPDTLHEVVVEFHQVASRRSSSLPPPLLGLYLKNLMNDPVRGNATRCLRFLRLAGPGVAPFLRGSLGGYDDQAHSMMVDLLLEWNEIDLPGEYLVSAMAWSDRAREHVKSMGDSALEFLRPALSDVHRPLVLQAAARILELGNAHVGEVAVALAHLLTPPGTYGEGHLGAERLLTSLGPAAEAALIEAAGNENSALAFTAGRGLLARSTNHAGLILDRAFKELGEDSRRDNARRAGQLLFELGELAVPRLKALTLERGQKLVCAAAVLARLGRLEGLPPDALDEVVRFADRFEEVDEPGSLVELLHWSVSVRKAVLQRMKPGRSAGLRLLLLDAGKDPWLTGRR